MTDVTLKPDVTLKSVLHEIVNHLDLNLAHRVRLHEDVDLHDDPEAQAEKAKGSAADRAAKRAALQAELDELEPEPSPPVQASDVRTEGA
jgi:hypothetical protein